ncbi:MAG: helix-turn-helix transcriptional regulator [Clostridia bacterium]|nr:helix-turn-helix transcriptional regulator [Clostridia bacterium]
MIQSIGQLHSPAGKTLLKMWQVQVAPGKRPLQRHFHTRFEITLICSGGGIYTTDRGNCPMKPGDIFVFASNEFHCISDVAEEGLSIINLHFEPYFLEGMSENHLNLCYAHSPAFKNRIPAETAADLQAPFLAVRQELESQEPEFALAIQSYLQQFMIALLRRHNYLDQKEDLPQMQNLMETLQYMDKHFTDPLTLQELARRAGVTPTYFSALFKNAFNLSPWDYITNKRVEHAIHLLHTAWGERNMLEIATLSGFNNTANFNKQFKRLTGMTPTQYHKSKEHIIH